MNIAITIADATASMTSMTAFVITAFFVAVLPPLGVLTHYHDYPRSRPRRILTHYDDDFTGVV